MRLALASMLILCACGGSDEPAPSAASSSSAGGEEASSAPTGPDPAGVEEVRDLVRGIGLGPTADAARRLRDASYRVQGVESVRLACLQLVEAFVAGSVEAFDADAQCFARLDALRTTYEVADAPDLSGFRALIAEARAERHRNLPPLPPGFASDNDERVLQGELTDDDPRLPNGTAYDEHVVELTPGWTVTIDLVSSAYDTFLYLHGADGRELAADDDGGEGLNSRIVHRVTAAGAYRVRAGAFSARGRGPYRLTVALSAE
ncbi:MAG: PPC domain-containing protein [Sandaracinaceae bacterium]|nr:PPC domain-containing protein [Sandaracinaceae bacterium]